MSCRGHEFIVKAKSMTFTHHIFFQIDKNDRAKIPQCFDIISRLFGGQNVADCNVSGVLHPSLLSRRLKPKTTQASTSLASGFFRPYIVALLMMTLFTGSVARFHHGVTPLHFFQGFDQVNGFKVVTLNF